MLFLNRGINKPERKKLQFLGILPVFCSNAFLLFNNNRALVIG